LSEGFLYIVYGSKRYFKEAETSVKSLRRWHHDAQVTLITDNKDYSNKLWNDIQVVPRCPKELVVDGKFEFKVDTMDLTPYERTLFVDTDTYFLGNVEALFKLLDYYDMALLPKSGEADIKDPEPPHLTVQGHTPYNTGIILFKLNSKTRVVFSRWRDYYRSQRPIQRSKNDQTYFLLALAKTTKLKVHALPANYNARFSGYLGLTGYVKILHAAGQKGLKREGYEEIASTINATDQNRGWSPRTKTVAW